MIVQKINIGVEGTFDMAFKYFAALSVLNGMNLVKRDLQLIAYSIAENKPVSEVKVEFIEKFGSSMATVGNIISKLYKLNILKKNKRVVSIHPVFLPIAFEEDILLAIKLKHTNGN
mgnify:CR=1 FL=1